MSSHRKRSLLFLYFPVGNSVCQLFARFISIIPFLYYTVNFLASFCHKIPKQNVNSVNRLSNSSLFVVVMFPPKTSALCTRARNDRNWREKRSTRCLPSWSKPLSYRKLPIMVHSKLNVISADTSPLPGLLKMVGFSKRCCNQKNRHFGSETLFLPHYIKACPQKLAFASRHLPLHV